MAAFGNQKHFDAVAYLANRPQYSDTFVNTIKAWHDEGTGKYDDALDIGCGPGQMTYRLAESFHHVVGADPSPIMLRAAQDPSVPGILNVKIPAEHQISFKEAKGQSTGLPDGSFDLINAATAAHWLPWKEDPSGVTVWKEMARLLRPGGSLVFAGYINLSIENHEYISDRIEEFFQSAEGWQPYLETAEELSPHTIGYSYYKTMPKPVEPYFDASQTTILRLRLHPSELYSLTAQDIFPIPPWATKVGLTSTDQPVVTQKNTLRGIALLLRSVSCWPRYLDVHPEEKELEARNEDLPFRLLENLRREEEQKTGKLLDWDEEIQLFYSCVMLFARKR